MTRLQRILCVLLTAITAGATVTAYSVHAEAEEGRRAIVAAEESRVRWLEVRVLEVAAEGRLRELQARTVSLREAIATADAALARARAAG
jgi:hypothetical protein